MSEVLQALKEAKENGFDEWDVEAFKK